MSEDGLQVRHVPLHVWNFSMENKAKCLSGTVLVLEDEAIIVLGTTIILENLGADRVLSASTVAEAIVIAENNELSFAMLDVMLGHETCEPVAQLLTIKNVPFVFATGMGDQLPFTARFPASPILSKPYLDTSIMQAAMALNTVPEGSVLH